VEIVVFVAAEERELAAFRRRLMGARRLDWPAGSAVAGRRGGQRFLLVAGGAGPRLAAQALEPARKCARVGAIVSTGFCGGLRPELRPGQVFVASEVREVHTGARYAARLPRTSRPYASGTLLSIDRIVGEPEKRQLRELGGDAVEMEAAAVARSAAAWDVPFYCIRAVTDTAQEGFRCDLNAARLADGRISYAKLLLASAARPAERLPELWRLWRRARLAAEALGEFLAGCTF
jgi:adenosylhomocysteine nucleosidase